MTTRVLDYESDWDDDEEHEHVWKYDYSHYHCSDCGEEVDN